MTHKNISIIICSRQSNIPTNLQENIAATIGADYELIIIDNSANQYSIFSAYNEGVRRANGDILCFMHEDVIMHTHGWGMRVLNHFNADDKLGCIGVAGGHVMPKAPAAWWHADIIVGGCLQTTNGKTIDDRKLDSMNGANITEVVAVDGVWFCIPKHLFEDSLLFDEKTFKGFHCYDVDICLQVRSAGYKVCVVADIVVEHLSWGYLNRGWFQSTDLLYQKWESELPQCSGGVVNCSKSELYHISRLVRDKYNLLRNNLMLNEELQRIQTSSAYRIGKIITRPFRWLKRKLTRK